MKKIFLIPICLGIILQVGCFKELEDKFDVSEIVEPTFEQHTERKWELPPVHQIPQKHYKSSTLMTKDEDTIEENGIDEKESILTDEKTNDALTQKFKKLRGEIQHNILDWSILDSKDNKTYSWWLRLNNTHDTPGIDPHAEKILDTYDIIYIGDTSQKKVYLTFDEGYENGYTSQILDILKANDVKAIFFITGSYFDRNIDLVRRMMNEGHKVGNHSINHPSLPNVSNEVVEKELLDLEKKFYDEFGVGFEYVRPPRGEYSDRTLNAATQLGYKNVFWSYAYKDYDVNDQRGTQYAYDKIMGNLHNGMVPLIHAVSKDNAEALDSIIKDMKSQGYELCEFNL